MPNPLKNNFTPATTGPLAKLDQFMLSHVAMPRIIPYFLYVAGASLNNLIDGYLSDYHLYASYPIGYLLFCTLIAYILWRYRKLTPEINAQFHWLAIPTGLLLIVAWIGLGWYFSKHGNQFPLRYQNLIAHNAPPPDAALDAINPKIRIENHKLNFIAQKGAILGYLSLSVRVIGMTLLVPFLEEVLMRSLLLRALAHPKKTMKMAFLALLDFPAIGDALINTKLAQRIEQNPPSFEDEFRATPLGQITCFGVIISSLVFAIGHAPRDYAAAMLCGITWCILLKFTKNKGLGPVIWSHGIANAALVAYVLYYNDWQFL